MKNSSAAPSTSTSTSTFTSPYTSSLISRVSSGLALVALVLPWINPFEPGPADAVVQYLLSMVAARALTPAQFGALGALLGLLVYWTRRN